MNEMTEQVLSRPARPQVSLARIVLPTEHGSWSFLLEPIIVGSSIAFSATVPWIVLMFTAAFFARQPLKVYWLSRNNQQLTDTSFRYLLMFLVVATAGLLGTVWTAGAWAFYPLAAAAPLAAQQIYFDLFRKGRSLAAELSGAVAISSSAASLLLAGGLDWATATALWLIFVCRFVPSILYVRNRLSLEKGKTFNRLQPIVAHVLGLIVVVLLASVGSASLLTVGVFAFLLLRSIHGLSSYRVKMKAMKIGVWEVVYGVLTIISIIAGYYAGI